MYLTEDNLRRFCLLKLTKKNKTCKPIDSNICHVWTECLNHSLNTNWVLAGEQVHISEMVYLKNILRINVFYLCQTFMLIQAWVSLKAERRKLLERLGVGTEDTGEKIAPLLSLREALHIWFLLSFQHSYQISQLVLEIFSPHCLPHCSWFFSICIA